MNRKGEFCNSLLPISRIRQQATVGGVDLHLRTELQRLKMRRTVQCQCQPFSPPANKDGCRIDTIVLTIDHINVTVSFSILISDDLEKMPRKGFCLFVAATIFWKIANFHSRTTTSSKLAEIYWRPHGPPFVQAPPFIGLQ